MKILLADSFDESLPKKLAPFGDATTDMAQLSDADVVLVRSKTKVTKEFLAGAPKLKLVIRGGVGLDNVDIEACREKGIEVKNTPRASSVAVAELTMALMLAVPNRLVEGHNAMKDGKWLKKELKRTELYGKTLGLLGAGLIGTEVARRALAFGMKVVAYDKYVSKHPTAQMKGSLEELLAESDYISMHIPLTPETKGMINADTIAKMKKGVRIVNTARGKAVIEEDLRKALESGHVAGYATDVWYSDPPEGSPLIDAPNVVMAPHIGAETKENLLRIGDIIEELVEKFTSK